MRAILAFHSIDDSGSVLSYPPPDIARLIEALRRSELAGCEFDTPLRPETSAGVALTFDDGLRSVITAALPVVKDFAVPAHLFLTTGAGGGETHWPTQPALAPRFAMLSWAE